MYDMANDDCGVLIDYDIPHSCEDQRLSNTSRIGTMPFLALELLDFASQDKEVPRLYRHDCESFVWVLLWICYRYENGLEIHNPPFSKLATPDYSRCLRHKQTITTQIRTTRPTDSYEYCAIAVYMLLSVHIKSLMQRYSLEALAQNTKKAPSTSDLPQSPDLTDQGILETYRTTSKLTGPSVLF